MSAARQVIPGLFYLLTRRCTQRQFLLRPDSATNNAYLYCLIVAAQRFNVTVLMMCAMSNHHHVVIRDNDGRYPEFIEHLHKLLARSQNALRGRWENFWASGQTSMVRLVDTEDILNKIVYTATNPVKDGLVDRVGHWPGVNGLSALLNARTVHARRPAHFFRAGGRMPSAVSIVLELPEALGSGDELRDEIRRRVQAFEEDTSAGRRLDGERIVGRRNVLRQSWKDAPTSFEPRRRMSPRIAAKNMWRRVEAIVRNLEFARAYARARRRWLDGQEAVFPIGTYWLRRFANVPIAG
jgi:REP element-mobilizing transposase RayT